MSDSWGRRLWGILIPIIIYEGLGLIIQSVVSSYWAINNAEKFITADNNIDQTALIKGLVEFTVKYGMLMQGIAAVAASLFLYRMYIRDYAKRRFVFERDHVHQQMWFFPVLIGVFASLSGNAYMNIGTWAQESAMYQQSVQMLFSAPLVLQVVFIGFAIPICEELLFRGLIYMRMRQYTNINAAIIVSSLIFAMMHGNMVQGLYAFVIGAGLAYIYEKYGTLKAAMLLHISANLTSLALSVIVGDIPLGHYTGMLLGIGSAALIVAMGLIVYVDRNVQVKRIYLSDE